MTSRVTDDGCVACRKPFPPNHTLAALPNGRRVAFDPEADRLWRICHGCGYWNLCGREMAREALPEIRAHHKATAGEGTPGVGVSRVGDRLELLRVGDRSELVAGALALADRHRALRGAGLAFAVVFGTLTLLTIVMIAAGWGPDAAWLGQLAAWMGGMLVAQAGQRRLLGLRLDTARLKAAGILLGSGAVVSGLLSERGFLLGAVTAIGGGLVFGLFTESITGAITRVRLPSGRRLPATVSALRALTLRWSTGDETVTVVPRKGAPLDAADSRHVLTHLTEWVAGLPDPVVDQASALVATLPTLIDVLRLLPGRSDGSGGEVRLDDLPLTYWVALDMAVIREVQGTGEVEAIDEARRVADIAESLDA